MPMQFDVTRDREGQKFEARSVADRWLRLTSTFVIQQNCHSVYDQALKVLQCWF